MHAEYEQLDRSRQWLLIWEKKAVAAETPLHHIDGYDLLSPSQWQSMVSELASMLPLEAGAKLVELGCGCGAFIDTLRRMHPTLETTGVDYSASLIDVAKGRVGGAFYVGDARSCPALPSNHFDIACSFGTTMYLNSEQEVIMMLDEMRRITAPGGTLFVGEVSSAELREKALSLRALTHAKRRLVSDLSPDHLYVRKSLFTDYAARYGMKARIYDHHLAGFASANPLASYRFSVIMRARGPRPRARRKT